MLMTDVGASITEENGNEPLPVPNIQNLCPCRCIGWPICRRTVVSVGEERNGLTKRHNIPCPSNHLQFA